MHWCHIERFCPQISLSEVKTLVLVHVGFVSVCASNEKMHMQSCLNTIILGLREFHTILIWFSSHDKSSTVVHTLPKDLSGRMSHSSRPL